MTADRRGGNTIIGLDLIRFCAAFLVVWFHLAFWAKHAGSDAGPPLTSLPDLSASASMGWVGVEIFFVLSGIVISYSAEKASAWTFLRSRVLRIFPAIWICAPITFFILVLFGSFQFVTLTRMLVASAAVWPTGGWLDIVYWTLPIEINFYVFVFVLLCFRAFDRIDLLFAVLAIISAAAWGSYLVSLWCGPSSVHHAIDTALHRRTFHLLLVRHGSFFAVGGFIWLGFFKGFTPGRWFFLSLALAASLIEVCARALEQEGLVEPSAYPAASIWVVAVALMCASIAWDAPLRELFGRASKSTRVLGLATFPVYLLHNAAGVAIERQLLSLGVSPPLAIVFMMIAILIAAIAVVIFVEPQVRNIVHLLIDGVGWRTKLARSPAS